MTRLFVPTLAVCAVIAVSQVVASAQVNFVGVTKTARYTQSAPDQTTLTGYDWRAITNTSGGVTAMTVDFTRAGATVTVPLTKDGDFLSQSNTYTTPAALTNDFPDTTYTFRITGGAGNGQSQSVTIPATTFPVVPQFTAQTYNALSTFDPTKPFTFAWNAFTPSPTGDFPIGFNVVSVSGRGGSYFSVQPNGATQATVSPGFFTAGEAFVATLTFNNRVGGFYNSGFGNGSTAAGYASSTSVAFTVVPEPSSLALLLLPILAVGGAGVILRRRTIPSRVRFARTSQ